jgi:pimeloyl-ACP methyl ester carboxylesterase
MRGQQNCHARPLHSVSDETAHVLDRPGVRLHYRRTPRRVGPAVVLLHGLASNLTRWSEFVAATSLRQQAQLIRLDLRGHGDSDTRGRVGLEAWSDDLIALLDAEAQPQAVLVGHSLGAQVALHCAAHHPGRVRALVLIDPVFRAALRGRWRLMAAAGPLFALAATAVRGANAVGLRRRQLAPLDLEALDSSTRADLRSFRSAHYLQELVELFRPLPPPASYAQPMLVLLSTGATFAALAATRSIAAGFPHGRVQTIDCHHWPLTERPFEVRQAIEGFVAPHIGPYPAATPALR